MSLVVGRPCKLALGPAVARLTSHLLLDLAGVAHHRLATVADKWSHTLPSRGRDSSDKGPGGVSRSPRLRLQASLATSQVLIELQLPSQPGSGMSGTDTEAGVSLGGGGGGGEGGWGGEGGGGRGVGGEVSLEGGGAGCGEAVRAGVLVAWDRLMLECPCTTKDPLTGQPTSAAYVCNYACVIYRRSGIDVLNHEILTHKIIAAMN